MELGPSAVLFPVKADHMGQLLAVQRLPGVLPTVGNLGQLRVAGGNMKSEFASWGDGIFVHFGEPLGEAGRVWRLLPDVAELDEEEIRVRFTLLSPGMAMGSETRGHAVDRLERLEFPLNHCPARVTELDGL